MLFLSKKRKRNEKGRNSWETELLFFQHSKQKLPNKDITWELLNTFNYTLITWSFCFVKAFTASKQIYERRRNENFRAQEMFCAEPHLATRATLIREHIHNIRTHSNQPIITRSKCTLQMKRCRKLRTTRDTFLESPETLGAFRVQQFSLYLQNDDVSRHETIMNLLLISIPLTHMKRPPLQNKRVGALQNKRVGVLQMAFGVRNVFGTFEKRTPGHKIGKGKKIKINANWSCIPDKKAHFEKEENDVCFFSHTFPIIAYNSKKCKVFTYYYYYYYYY